MIKTFIGIISMQGRRELQKVLYAPQGFTLQNNVPSSFPIVPFISNEIAESGATRNILVIALCADDEDSEYNFQNNFLPELKNLGIAEDQVVRIPCSISPGIRADIRTIFRIIDTVPENSVVCADITHGTKMMSLYVMYACIYMEQLKKVEVERVCYGELPWVNDEPQNDDAKMHDITAMKDLNAAIDGLRTMEISDIRGALMQINGI